MTPPPVRTSAAPRTAAFVALALALDLAGLGGVSAAPPQLNDASPSGVRRGEDADLTFAGANLGANPRLVAPFGFTVDPKAPAGSDGGKWVVRLRVDPATPVGAYPVRLLNDEGLSNPLLVSVGQLPQVAEVEENGTFETAQVVTTPAVIEGKAAGNDVDYFRFAGKAGQKILVDAQCARIGSGVDPSVRLTTAGRGFVASADDSAGLLTDARLVATLPEDGDYVIELSDTRYQGGGRPIYRLVVGEVPAAAEVYPIGGRSGETLGLELRGGTLPADAITAVRVPGAAGLPAAPVRLNLGAALDLESLPAFSLGGFPEVREPADASAPPPRVAAPVVLNGRIDPAGDEDRFTLAVNPGDALAIEVEASESGSALDGVLQVLGPKGNVLANADDTPATRGRQAQNPNPGLISPDPTLDFTVPNDVREITLAFRDLESRGGVGFAYRIKVGPAGPAFDLAPNESQIAVPRGGTASVGLAVARRGYNGPILVRLADPPPGFSFRPARIADGQLVGALTVSAAPDAPDGVVALAVVGETPEKGAASVRNAVKSVVFARQANLPTSELTQDTLPAAAVPARAVTVDAPEAPLDVAHGLGANVALKVVRTGDAAGALEVKPAEPLPPGLAAAPSKIAEKADGGSITLNTTFDLPRGAVTVALAASGKINGADRTFAVPAVTLNVVRGVEIELDPKGREVKAGGGVELKGKVVRKAGYQGPVTVRLDNLPAGVKAESATVAPDATEFTLNVSADPKAAAATASPSAVAAFQVNGKDYPAPPSVNVPLKVVPAP